VDRRNPLFGLHEFGLRKVGLREFGKFRRGKFRRTKFRLGAIVASGILFLACAPAVATASVRYDGAEDHYAGSQIAAIEGIEGVPGPVYGPDARVLGHDVSGHQGAVDWPKAVRNGAKFVYIKATEGTGFLNSQFAQQYNGSYKVGMVRGAYHFARPDASKGADQANYFVDHGGGWSDDGRTLPGALDVEYNPYGDTCYGLDAHGMTTWIKDFSDTYLKRTGRSPLIYTSTKWWKRCTGNSADFAMNPLWVAHYTSRVGELPASWQFHTIWQFASKGILPGDQNYFNGAADRLAALTHP
jgi:GH25 family lysozyme M1 (1,4-beta-N-acetylmuramidase)